MKLKRINESIASEDLKKDKEETEANVIKPVEKEEKVLEPVNDEVHVAAVDGLEQNKEAAKEVVEDSSVTKNAEELVKEENKEKHESLNVKSRVELAKLISEAKKNNQTYKISKCLEEGYRYTFEITGTEKLAEDLEDDAEVKVIDLSDEGEPEVTEIDIQPEDEPAKEEKSPLDVIKEKFDIAVLGGEDGKIIIAAKGDLEKEDALKLELPVTEEEFVVLSPVFAEPVKEFLDANVSVGSNNSMDGNTGVGLEVPVDVQANGNDVTVGGATTSVLEDSLEKDNVNKVDEECKKENLEEAAAPVKVGKDELSELIQYKIWGNPIGDDVQDEADLGFDGDLHYVVSCNGDLDGYILTITTKDGNPWSKTAPSSIENIMKKLVGKTFMGSELRHDFDKGVSITEECKQEEGLGSAITGLTKDIPVVNMLLADDENEKKDLESEEDKKAFEGEDEEVFAAEEEEIPVDDDFFGEDPEPIYDDEFEDEEKVLEVKPEEIKETEVLSKFDDFEPAEEVKEFWGIVKESGKLDDLEFFLDEFDIDDNEKLADFLADEDHRDYLLSALGLGADIETFEDDEVAPVDYDEE